MSRIYCRQTDRYYIDIIAGSGVTRAVENSLALGIGKVSREVSVTRALKGVSLASIPYFQKSEYIDFHMTSIVVLPDIMALYSKYPELDRENEMRVVSLIENTKLEGSHDLVAEHGLSLYIESNGKKILFDTGASEAFDQNAFKLGIKLEEVDALVISHHHYDHGGGLARFLEVNQTSKVYLRKSEEEDFYFRIPGIVSRYVGLDQELLEKRADRFEFVDSFTEILPNMYILTGIPQSYALPKGNQRLFIKKGKTFSQDRFQHELIMVHRDADELVVFTGCAHNGILNMVGAVTGQFPGEAIKGVFGGFHLIGLPKLNTMAGSKRSVRGIAVELMKFPIERIYTGHCTGRKAYQVLKGVMAEKLDYFPTGSEVLL